MNEKEFTLQRMEDLFNEEINPELDAIPEMCNHMTGVILVAYLQGAADLHEQLTRLNNHLKSLSADPERIAELAGEHMRIINAEMTRYRGLAAATAAMCGEPFTRGHAIGAIFRTMMIDHERLGDAPGEEPPPVPPAPSTSTRH